MVEVFAMAADCFVHAVFERYAHAPAPADPNSAQLPSPLLNSLIGAIRPHPAKLIGNGCTHPPPAEHRPRWQRTRPSSDSHSPGNCASTVYRAPAHAATPHSRTHAAQISARATSSPRCHRRSYSAKSCQKSSENARAGTYTVGNLAYLKRS